MAALKIGINRAVTLFTFMLAGLVSFANDTKSFILVDEHRQATVSISESEPECVRFAVQDLINDVEKITGKVLKVTEGGTRNSGTVFIQTKTDHGKWESYSVVTKDGNLYITGSDERGTMFGVYYFIENYLGVDPFYWWSGIDPEKKETLQYQAIDYTSRETDFKFRGWFINDEDLLTEFMPPSGKRRLDYPYYQQIANLDLMDRVFEAMVRARFNLVIPASFLEIFNPAEEKLVKRASVRGLFVSQHHIEPMGVSAFGYFNYWERKTGEKPVFSFYSERDKLLETWEESAKKWSRYPNVIWQIGLRGIGDRPMWMADPGVPQSDKERAGIISDAMKSQMEIIRKYAHQTEPLVSTTLWAEGALFNEKGLLHFPENTIIVFADNSPGWKMQDDFFSTKREAGINYGIYFHHGLIVSGPHLAQAVPPSKVLEIFSLAKQYSSNYYAILNVGNIREFLIGLIATRDVMEDSGTFDPKVFLQEWCTKHFGMQGTEAARAYQSYFDSYALDDEKGLPLLLDGQMQGKGRSVLLIIRELRNQQPKEVENNQNNRPVQKNSKTDSFYQSLSDTNPAGKLSLKELLVKVEEQKQKLAETGELAEEVSSSLSGQQKSFFDANLLAQQKIMQGITSWLKECILAKEMMEKRNVDQSVYHLEKALEHTGFITEGMSLASQEKWADWYRGDKKLNMERLIRETEETLKQLKTEEK
ncbi:MAG: hypothetical protein A2W89_05035 [Bacteroidetes bacterium GWE2_42_39]|nr:MAG: hypothetical protein A2W92_08785 [Bacteroidetes bacterium GWA2_42_15]OFX96227.1 MAG: hypothetical protein A2W89_05035 [Bacteroidetes bacterium GWE2_42_39]